MESHHARQDPLSDPVLSGVAVIAVGSVTVACSSLHGEARRNQRSAEFEQRHAEPDGKERADQRDPRPMSVSPGGGNVAVPCGFGPAGGGPAPPLNRTGAVSANRRRLWPPAVPRTAGGPRRRGAFLDRGRHVLGCAAHLADPIGQLSGLVGGQHHGVLGNRGSTIARCS